MKSDSERHGSLPSRLACWRRKWKFSRRGFAFAIGVELDVVANGICGEKSIDAASGDRFFGDHFVEQGVAFGEELASLYAAFAVLEDARVDALESPSVEEGSPVDEIAERGERKIV